MNNLSQVQNQNHYFFQTKPGLPDHPVSQGHGTRKQAIRAKHTQFPWITGTTLGIFGISFLWQRMGVFSLNNSWALFILFPAMGAFANAWRIFLDAAKHPTYAARNSLLAGSMLFYIAAACMLQLNWLFFGPMLILLTGVCFFLNRILPF